MAVIRGPYKATYNGLDVGNTLVGFRETYSYTSRPITFDALGETPVEHIFTGMTMFVEFVAQEYDAAAIDALRWPFGTGVPGQLTPAGQSLWDAAKPLILTACDATLLPQTKTYFKAILAPDYELETRYSHQERPLPMRAIIFPVKYDSTGTYSPVEPPEACEQIVFFTE